MIENEQQLSPEESMQLIESMINRAKNRFGEDGHMYLFWGWLIFFCSIAEFVLYNFFNYEKHYMVWLLTCLGLIYQVIYMSRGHKKRGVKTYTGNIIGYVWLTYVILEFLVGFLIGRLQGGEYFFHIFPIVLALYGMPLFLSGVIIRFTPLIAGAVYCWVLSIVVIYVPFQYQMLGLSMAMIGAWIIPGYMLRAKYKSTIN